MTHRLLHFRSAYAKCLTLVQTNDGTVIFVIKHHQDRSNLRDRRSAYTRNRRICKTLKSRPSAADPFFFAEGQKSRDSVHRRRSRTNADSIFKRVRCQSMSHKRHLQAGNAGGMPGGRPNYPNVLFFTAHWLQRHKRLNGALDERSTEQAALAYFNGLAKGKKPLSINALAASSTR